MSLHQLAKQVQDQGRGEDTQLIHMTPKEIKGLQQLAMAHGGSLTINPTTGLPEAGFLSSILPTVVGAGVGVATMNPMLGAAVGGGLGMAMNQGSLKSGIMAGIGAYGFGSMGAGMMAAGEGALGTAAGIGAGEAAVAGSSALAGTGITTMEGATAALNAGTITPSTYANIASQYSGAYAPAAGEAIKAAGPWDTLSQGFKSTSFDKNYLKENMFPIGAAALGTIGAMEQGQDQGSNLATTQNTPYIRPYTYSQTKNPNYGQPGQAYFNQTFTPQTPVNANTWGSSTFADGGEVNGDMRQGGMFPQSQQDPVQFAVPTQRPVSAEVVNAGFDPKVSPFSGEVVRMADGGTPPVVPPNPQVGIVPLAAATNAYTLPKQVTPQAVTDYNKLLAERANNEYNVQPVPLNMLPGGGANAQNLAAGDVNKMINQYYLKNLGRQADQAGVDYWTQQAQSGIPMADVNKGIAGSSEAQISGLYRNVLGRAPDAAGMEYWQKALNSGTSLADITNTFKTSSEGAARPGNAIAPVASVDTTAKPTLGGYTFDPVTKQYVKAPTPAPAEAATDLLSGLDPAVLQAMYADYQRQQQYQNQGATGGLTSDFAKYANGGIADLGGYSDGGRLLKGPGDGVSDSIPAQIGNKQPARLADGEFVIPARIVSELGNGSTDAGARRLYAMMDRIQHKRKKSIGKSKVAVDSKAEKDLPA